jgi:hypothetical protein
MLNAIRAALARYRQRRVNNMILAVWDKQRPERGRWR